MAGGLNLYGYGSGDPVNNSDPFGLCEWCRQLGDVIAGSVPGVATAHDVAIAVSGRNVVTGETVGLGGRALAGAGVFLPVSSAQLKQFANVTHGAYTILFKSGMTYHGKGTVKRALQSAREKFAKFADEAVGVNYAPAKSRRDAFIEEHRRIDGDGGPGKGNYNEINSPGKKMSERNDPTPN